MPSAAKRKRKELNEHQLDDVFSFLELTYANRHHHEECQQMFAKFDEVPAAERNAMYYLLLWSCANKLALRASALLTPDSQLIAEKYFNKARDAIQHARCDLESKDARHFVDHCLNQANLCENRADSVAESMQYEFAIEFMKHVERDVFCPKNTRSLAQIYLKLADAMSRNNREVLVQERVAMNIRSAINKIETLPVHHFMPEDQRFLLSCYKLMARHHHERNEHQDANNCYEKAIQTIFAIPVGKRNSHDEANLQELHRLGKHEDKECNGVMAACKHYGLFATTSKTEHVFETEVLSLDHH